MKMKEIVSNSKLISLKATVTAKLIMDYFTFYIAYILDKQSNIIDNKGSLFLIYDR